jgi:hypothetical protein
MQFWSLVLRILTSCGACGWALVQPARICCSASALQDHVPSGAIIQSQSGGRIMKPACNLVVNQACALARQPAVPIPCGPFTLSEMPCDSVLYILSEGMMLTHRRGAEWRRWSLRYEGWLHHHVLMHRPNSLSPTSSCPEIYDMELARRSTAPDLTATIVARAGHGQGESPAASSSHLTCQAYLVILAGK